MIQPLNLDTAKNVRSEVQQEKGPPCGGSNPNPFKLIKPVHVYENSYRKQEFKKVFSTNKHTTQHYLLVQKIYEINVNLLFI